MLHESPFSWLSDQMSCGPDRQHHVVLWPGRCKQMYGHLDPLTSESILFDFQDLNVKDWRSPDVNRCKSIYIWPPINPTLVCKAPTEKQQTPTDVTKVTYVLHSSVNRFPAERTEWHVSERTIKADLQSQSIFFIKPPLLVLVLVLSNLDLVITVLIDLTYKSVLSISEAGRGHRGCGHLKPIPVYSRDSVQLVNNIHLPISTCAVMTLCGALC